MRLNNKSSEVAQNISRRRLLQSLGAAGVVSLASSSVGATMESNGSVPDWCNNFNIDIVEEESVTVVGKDGPVAQHNIEWDPDNFEWTFKTFTDVLDPEDGTLLTSGADPERLFDHHRGIFIGWDKLTVDGNVYDLWHMDSGEKMVHQYFEEPDDFQADNTLTSIVHWITQDDETLIEETRELTFYEAPTEDGIVWIDLTSTMKATAGAPVELLSDPEHGGTQYRPSEDVADNGSAEYIFPDGFGLDDDPSDDEIVVVEGLPWVGQTHTINDQQYFVQHMNHEDNPDDTVYSAYRDYGRFGAFFEDTIPDGESLTVKYGFLIKRGSAPSQESLNDYYNAFVGKNPEHALYRKRQQNCKGGRRGT